MVTMAGAGVGVAPWLVTLALLPISAGSPAVAQPRWMPLGPAGGPASVVAYAPSSPRIAYAGTAFAGVFRSEDGGASWKPANTGFDDVWVLALAVSPEDPAVLYASFGVAINGPPVTPSIAFSSNGGVTWQDASPAPGSNAYSFGFDPHDPSLLYTATSAGLFRTHFGSTSWSRVAGFSTQSIAVDPANSSILYITGGQDGGVSKSVDGGRTWSSANGNMDNLKTDLPFNLLFDPTLPNTLYVVVFSEPFLLRTTDGGQTWAATGLSTAGVIARITSLVASATGTLYLSGVYGSPRFLKSVDHGVTWQRTAGDGPSDRIIQNVGAAPGRASSPDAETLLAAGDFGLWRSGDGGQTWIASSLGMSAQNLETLEVAADGTLFLGVTGAYGAGDGVGLFRGSAHGRRMRRLSQLGGEQVVTDPRAPGTLYSGPSPITQRSVDGGKTWTTVGFPEGDLVIDPTLSSTLYTTRVPEYSNDFACPLARSFDSGAHWSCIEPGFQEGFAALIVDPLQPATLYGLNTDRVGAGLVERSDDRGSTWRSASAGLRPKNGTVLAIDPSDSTLYVVTPRGLYSSTDRAQSWRLVSTDLPAGVNALIVDPRDPSRLFAGAPGSGIFGSSDGGVSWAPVGQGLPLSTFGGLFALDPVLPLTLYAATSGHGAFRLDLAP